MLHGSIWDKIPRFALPVAATAILEQLFNASDLAVVGNFTGDQRTAAVAAALALILPFGKQLLTIFNSDPAVVDTGYIRLVMVMLAHSFSMLFEVMSGYLRGFGISLTPAVLTMVGVCGIRIAWIQFVFPHSRTFRTIMTVYPISLAATAVLIFGALVICRPARRFAAMQQTDTL